MFNKRQQLLTLLFMSTSNLWLGLTATRADSYDLKTVNGIQAFSGSAGARELLAKNGFVVADPTFKQIFQAHIESPQVEEPSEKNPMGTSLPSFITTDSAWHTYHVLLEEGVKQMEEVQLQRLLKFSQELLKTAKEQQAGSDVVLFASIGLALQDESHRQTLAAEEKRVVDGLRSGAGEVRVPIGFDLMAAQFRAQSFYTQSPELTDYFTARQWYASVVFRLSDARETRAAVTLARIVNGNPQLLSQWKQLSEPFDTLLATAEDGSIREYADAASVLGNATSISDVQLAEIQKKLASRLPFPRVNDQMMTVEQFLEFSKQTRGFRVLPPRRLPCAECFQNTVYPKIPNRYLPSGLDFMAASRVLRSPAAVRALQSEFGKDTANLILKTDCGPMPDSLHGQAMELLAKLQEPLPSRVPAPLRTEAWQDLQLWTQLGAWAEQRHTWALHVKMTVMVAGIITPPKGMVAPYPDFFAGLATLTRRTADAFQRAGLDRDFDPKSVADELQKVLDIRSHSRGEESEKYSGQLEQLGEFEGGYYNEHQSDLEKAGRDAWKQMEKDLQDLAQRGSSGQTNLTDTKELRRFYDCRQNVCRLLKDFAPVCDRLTELAKKSLEAERLTDDDAKWIENYGVTLASLNFYYGNSYEVPEDNFPIVARVFYDPVGGKMLYAGLARPQALYVIVPNGKALQLYRGAVMTYREFARSDQQLLDDESWREMVTKGQTPPAPPFTKSFYAETSVAELLKQLQAQKGSENANYRDISDILWQIGARATEKDLPQLLEAFVQAKGPENGDVSGTLSYIIGRLPWKSDEKQLLDLLASPDTLLANAAARIVLARPDALDLNALVSRFDKQPVHARRLYCAIVSAVSNQTDATRQMLLGALRDPADGVRWQAALAIGNAKWNDEESRTALLKTLEDTNELVAAAAVHSFVKSGATNVAPELLTKLKTQAQLPALVSDTVTPQAEPILENIMGRGSYGNSILDVDGLAMRIERPVTKIMQSRASLRMPPLPIDFPMHNYNLTDALIEALGDLGYAPAVDELFKLRGTDYDKEATKALDKLAPDRLAGEFLKTALDKQTDSYLRDKALIALSDTSATNHVRELIPLLDDTTPIVYTRSVPGMEWRICDRSAETIAILLGWEDRRMRPHFMRPDQRDALMSRTREWAKQAN